ncbi:MAG: aminopeptidase [Flavobacteriales bacterium CG03_land_8_20_14_0_80_35_15]|nr:MAG: aminopeptidase [Flavobacteriaceae bacterium CG1_02_35_72]PIR13339.1 MAG: aminopeptidase [Flavobacteriales bacterium CG11_big_fil_rev_8_21_14_0_20_35_7]PIV16339.1 MAG: aminopeptidase [Flavobacteriales bacterium CG03_land_8_20_14_0_80_35_15]PIX06075.1 MAG: aminopeptidase [Flavobacteriales bacterium CG_4_8_14_3_um_filter_35_10]PJA05720.1 MAG: aminopeptidase [Flavobacteriales bacterium CG_4_10_14_0_2_um_filter_35_18]
MKRKAILFVSCLFIYGLSIAQDLYMPRDVQRAINNKTRDLSGNPGKNYWQNKAVYSIKIKVTPPNKTIYGSEEIFYTNNSPDTLKVLNFKLYSNNHKSGAARLWQVDNDYITSGIHIDNYLENGSQKEWKSDRDGTNKIIKLANKLAPNQSIKLNFDWHYDMSVQSGREGAIDSTTFFIAYFYPRVAVYDDYNGWDTMSFTGSQEFYNDFNDYTVSVTVPKNYIVWGTGDLENTDEVLQSKYADLYKIALKSDSIFSIANPENLKQAQITKQNAFNTWIFKANHITDVALALSNHYNWDAGSVVVDSLTMRRASVQAAYDDVSADFHKMVEFGKHALNWFSNYYPGVPYPFSKSTIVRGFADMEYPMMVNDNSESDLDFSRFVAEHEIAHSYFPFYMGINETRFAFMDEGWATTLEHLIGIADLGTERAINAFKNFRVNRWINDKNMEEDLPIITPSNILTGVAYGNNAYGKPALGYLALKDMLGDQTFKNALKAYMESWHGKHPIPWDFFYAINNHSGKNLNWFWSRWYFSNYYIDLGIKSVKVDKKKVVIILQNIGGMPAPFDVIVNTKSGAEKIYHKTSQVWQNNNNETTIIIEGLQELISVKIDGGIFMDANTADNTWQLN